MKKAVALLSVFVFFVFCIPPQEIAADTENIPTVTISSPYATAGEIVAVDVNIRGNVGIFGAILTFEFPPQLQMIEVVQGDAFAELHISFPDSLTSPFTIVCDGMDTPAMADGTICTFHFLIAEDTTPDAKLKITASYLEGDVVDGDFNDLDLIIESGFVSVIDYIPGDVNENHFLDTTDVRLILQMIIEPLEFTEDQMQVADINRDDVVNSMDARCILLRLKSSS